MTPAPARDGGQRSHLRGDYLVRNPLLAAYLRATDAALGLVARVEAAPAFTDPPRRILVAIGGHLGDAIIATSAIELLRHRFPDAALGVLTPSWSAMVFAGDDRIRHRHVVDHWRVNRGAGSVVAKMARYRATARAAIETIRATQYDAAFDLYPYYPNSAGVLWRAGIPRRAGFATAGRTALYTHALTWTDDRVHIAEQHARLVRLLVPDVRVDTPLPSAVAPVAEPDIARARATLARSGVGSDDAYIVLHAGSGTRKKEWPPERWRELASRLGATGRRLVFTGAGADEERLAAALARDLPNAVSLVGQLDWAALSGVIAQGSLVICGDTSVAHLAAAVRAPSIVLYSGINPVSEWHPLGAADVTTAWLTNEVHCAPCFRRDGCATMACIRDVTVDDVMDAATSILPR